jgi:hypothetical protein
MAMVLKLDRGRAGARRRLASESDTVNPFSFQLFLHERRPFPGGLSRLLGGRSLGTLATLAVLGALVSAAAACDGGPRSSGEASGTGSLGDLGKRLDLARQSAGSGAPETARALGGKGDAGDFEIKIDPPAPAGDLKAEIARFTTIDACVAERARVDPIVGDALEAIGYDTFLRDACRVVDAAKANDPARCAGIDASSLEARCRATVAEVSASPETCPWDAPLLRARGRDAKCLAVASRDPRLCAGVSDALDRATCEATLTHDRRSCAKLRTSGAQSRCARDADRWGSLLDVTKETSAADGLPFVVTGTLHLESATTPEAPSASNPPAAKPVAIDVDLAPDLARGVTVVEQRDGARIAFGPLVEGGLDFIAPSPHTRGTLALELFVPVSPTRQRAHADAGAASSARLERVELLLPGRSPVSTPAAESTLVATVDRPGTTRGSPIAIEVHGTFGAAGSIWRLHAEATTFVRDIVTSSDLYAGPSSARSSALLGDDAGMR